MPDVTVLISHRLDPAEAKHRIEERLNRLRRSGDRVQLDHCHWTGDRLRFQATAGNITVNGSLEIAAGVAKITVALPWLMAPFRSQVRAELMRQGQQLLADV